MSALEALRTLSKVEKAAVPESRAFLESIRPAKNIVKTATGAEIDISRGYNVRGVDGVKIPFQGNTPLDKARQWTKNFYNPGDIEHAEDKVGLKGDPGSFVQYHKQADGTMRVVKSQVTEKGTGKGAGLYRALFNKAQQDGSKVVSDTVMTPESIAVWRRFKSLGYPIKENPMKKLDSGLGFENASSPNRPLFEFDPSQVKKDDKLPGFNPAPTVPPAPTKEHQELKDAVKQLKGVDPAVKEELNKRVLAYQEDPSSVDKDKLLEDIKGAAKPPTPQKLDPGVYVDHESGKYYQVGKDGSFSEIQAKKPE